MNKCGEFFYDISKKLVTLIFGAIIIYLTLLSLWSTCVEAPEYLIDAEGNEIRNQEFVYFVSDNPVRMIFIVAALIIVFWGLYLVMQRIRLSLNVFVLVKIICAAFFVVSLTFILSTRYELRSDPAKVMNAAYEFMHGDFHQFEPGEYINKNPQQIGFMLYMCGFILIFGEAAGLIMQIVNAAAIAVSYYYIAKIVYLFWHQTKAVVAVVVSMAVSIPMICYTTFVYGNIVGFVFVVMAIYQELMLFQDEKVYRIFLTAIFVLLSIFLKKNFLIVMIAMLILGIIEFSRRGKILLMLKFAGTILAMWFIGNQILTMAMSSAIGYDLPKGLPATTYIVMGIEYGGASPGAYNGRSADIYTDNNYDYDAANRAAKAKIADIMQGYMDDWRSGLHFFGMKQAGQWNEPSFQCFKILWSRQSAVGESRWIRNLTKGRISYLLLEIFNIAHTFILVGVCAYIFMFREDRKLAELIFAVIFIGGFLFHTFWEAKSEYTLLYFLLLIPYMVKGYGCLFHELSMILERIRSNQLNISGLIKRMLIVICATAVIIAAGTHVVRMKTFQYVFAPRHSQEKLEQYERQIEEIKNGEAYFN